MADLIKSSTNLLESNNINNNITSYNNISLPNDLMNVTIIDMIDPVSADITTDDKIDGQADSKTNDNDNNMQDLVKSNPPGAPAITTPSTDTQLDKPLDSNLNYVSSSDTTTVTSTSNLTITNQLTTDDSIINDKAIDLMNANNTKTTAETVLNRDDVINYYSNLTACMQEYQLEDYASALNHV
eukprot:CAMPEP_0196768068 /NCGR_PEP_ID=MMETSP1095-20130614/42304_1 /TAXON_ID=96789 ORGANISM="Chromulina nebulosa, Strain UTEXLB2642" /NCGR_SAMPLE_ID=MMETSP1095 /ASSEMBLY_ACC=CAM_ASM_000446 /LENGTH=183 /DNA_ID=CAMNT_0042137127 /DNA_START=903 /DNA_END=1455 /DNA_ORIENTATION=-